MARILVTGGAGYIGAHTCLALSRAGHEPVVLDDLSAGHEVAVRWGKLVKADIADTRAVTRAIEEFAIDAVIHFAGAIEAGQSMRDPARFYRQNVSGSLALIDTLRACGLRRIVFSSSAAVYGEPRSDLIAEDHPTQPVNVYGETKLVIERALHWMAQAGQIDYVALRYFNAAGAASEEDIGEAHAPETHLLPLAILAALGKAPPLNIFGTDYPTPDGSAVRDYVHVMDLARAHVAAVERLLQGGTSLVANLGTGQGHSVRDVVDCVSRLAGQPVPYVAAPRRPGDPARLVADPARAFRHLDWRPAHSDLAEIVTSALAWHRR